MENLKIFNEILSGAIDRGVDKIYARREVGLDEMMADLQRSKHIRMLGISLREFLVSSGHHYKDMERLLDEIKESKDRMIKILLINPYSEQATIRAERESNQEFSAHNRYEDSGLYSDVWQSIRYLSVRIQEERISRILEKESPGIRDGAAIRARQEELLKKGEEDLSKLAGPDNETAERTYPRIRAKVYNSAPACFLVITDSHTYIEQYHYGVRKSGLVGGNFPLLRFPALIPDLDGDVGANSTTSVPAQLKGHFDYIWDQRGTAPLTHLTQGHNIGVSKSAWECRLANLFSSRSWAEDRIKYLFSQEKFEIKLIGISLRDFFHAGKGLYTSVQDAAKNARVRALVLDPFSEQGRFRSKREEPDVKPSDGNNLLYEVSTSIRSVERLQSENLHLEARLYRGSTNCFAIVTSESVIVEQYHYGGSEPGATILGGKVAVLEYSAGSAMYAQIDGHFDHIWKELSKSIDEWKGEHPDSLRPSANVK